MARGDVVTREQLLERVWECGYFGDTRLPDVHVRQLRRKIEPDPGDPLRKIRARQTHVCTARRSLPDEFARDLIEELVMPAVLPPWRVSSPSDRLFRSSPGASWFSVAPTWPQLAIHETTTALVDASDHDAVRKRSIARL